LMGLLIVGFLGLVAGYTYKARLNDRFMTITRDKVYQSGAMPPEVLKERVRQHGIRVVIDLRRPENGLEEERTTLAELGVSYFSLPCGQHPKEHVVRAFLEIMDHRENRPVLIHCNNGISRSVIFAAIYRMEYEGWSNDRARRVAYWQSAFGDFALGQKKGMFLMNYIPRWHRSAVAAGGELCSMNELVSIKE
ncbi:MAG TPA: dual specificity protein phosphatase family protein, partial [Thermodesulfobacteriota bacterium]|nr:dual specificity protein phosphatase family protein [Thermodesulfobacteriota bacterium]